APPPGPGNKIASAYRRATYEEITLGTMRQMGRPAGVAARPSRGDAALDRDHRALADVDPDDGLWATSLLLGAPTSSRQTRGLAASVPGSGRRSVRRFAPNSAT